MNFLCPLNVICRFAHSNSTQRLRYLLMILCLTAIIALQFLIHRTLLSQNLFLILQIRIYKRRYKRVSLKNRDRFFLGLFSRLWKSTGRFCYVVQPATLVRFHRILFSLFWRWISRTHAPGHPGLSSETIQLIQRIKIENPSWTPARILGEVRRLGHFVSINTVRKYAQDPARPPGPGWKEFFSIHRPGIASMDFFTVPSWNFVPYYVFFIIDHSRRSILWVNVTTSPSLDWLKNQFRSAFTDNVPRILISDNDSVFRAAGAWLRNVMGIHPHFTRIMSPWQNGVAERWVRTVRRELTDHVIPLSEQHLHALLLEYVKHYNEDRTHTTLGLDSPSGREAHVRGSPLNVIRLPKVRGLSSRYAYRSAA